MTTYTDPFGAETIPPSQQKYAKYTSAVSETFFWPDQFDGTTGLLIAAITEIDATASGLTFTFPP